jgi:peptide-methionine (S)-S-oxide reductase
MEEKTEKATFAAGCFWHVQFTFDKIPGVVSTVVGYIGGTGNASYENAEEKGFAEAVQIKFNPKIISYKELLEYFWSEHDPTSLNHQGNDIGKRYRSAIFYHSKEQKQQAEKSKEKLQEKLKNKIVTEIVPAKEFYKAEEYHQKYLEKN